MLGCMNGVLDSSVGQPEGSELGSTDGSTEGAEVDSTTGISEECALGNVEGARVGDDGSAVGELDG